MRSNGKERRGVAGWDVDSTMVNIRPIFMGTIAQAAGVLCENLEDQDAFSNRFYHYQSQVMQVHHVDPNKIWAATLERMRQEYGFSDQQQKQVLEIFMSIYTTVPTLFPGIAETLATLNEAGYDQIYVTHAKEDWTDFKMKSTGIEDFFQGRVVVDVTGPKTYKDWEQGKKLMNVRDGEEVWAIGDNIKADLVAAQAAGIQNLIWANYSIWGNVAKVELPKGNVHTALEPLDIPRIILSEEILV